MKIPWFKIAWKIANYASNAFFDRNPIYKEFDGYQYISSGAIDFNNKTKDIGPRAYHVVTVPDKHREIDAFAQTSILGWLGKVVILIEDPSFNTKASKSVTHNQHLYYSVKSTDKTGDWRVSYVEEGKTKWDCWLFLWDTDIYSSAKVSPTLINGDMIDASTGKSKTISVISENGNMYIVPSSKHVREKIILPKTLNLEMLMNEFYDDNLEREVYDLKNYKTGDTIIFSDKIESISYDPIDNSTRFVFSNKSDDTNIEWAFLGDLTSKFEKGNSLELQFKVIPKVNLNGILLESLDFVEDGLNSVNHQTYPDINKYIVK